MRSLLAVLLGLFSILLHQGYALRCHYCNTVEDPLCVEVRGPNSPLLRECSVAMIKDTVDNIELLLGNDVQHPRVPSRPRFTCVTAVKESGEVGLGCSIPNHPQYDLCKRYGRRLHSCKTCTRDGCNYPHN